MLAKEATMAIIDHEALARDIAQVAHPLRGERADYDPLMDLIGDASVVLLGEASHGTHEFYRARAEITQCLIAEKGFAAVAVEADWPDAYRVNRYVRGLGNDRDAADALDDFQRFPLWMWRNHEVVKLVDWLRSHNRAQPEAEQAGFYGLDLYSLYGSVRSVVDYLETVDPEAAQQARDRYAGFDHAAGEAQQYGYHVIFRSHPDCEEEALHQLLELRSRRNELVQADGLAAIDAQFAAEQNALVVKNAETYYRAMFDRAENTWNLRDQHMSDTLDALHRHLSRPGRPAKVVVWEHNSHIVDASATDRSQRGEHNVGQLARRRYGDDCRLIGFTTYSGTVTAASDWDGPAEHKRVRPALRGSCEDLLHTAGIPAFFLGLQHEKIVERLREPMLQRFIGVIYLPQTERQSHYYHARLADQYDALFHFDHGRALEPLDRTPEWELGEAPETYPSGL
jgi:erythromycin esterase-like protein